MNIVDRPTEPRIKDLQVTDNEIKALLMDGRTISVPLAWSWRLSDASPEQRKNYYILGDGQGAHWPEIDEDISAEGMLFGLPAKRPQSHSASVAGKETSKADSNTHREHFVE